MSTQQLPATFADQLQAKLQSTIGEMIPPDAFKAMSEAAINKYIKETLPGQVERELRDFFHELIQAELRKPAWQGMWDAHGQQSASVLVEKIIIEKADVVLARMIGTMAQSIVQQMTSSLPRPY